MTDVTNGQDQDGAELSAANEQLLRELTERARTGGLKLTGEGLLGKLTKMVVEGALEGALEDHLGYEKNDPAGRNGGNSRNGYRAETVLTDAGPVESHGPLPEASLLALPAGLAETLGAIHAAGVVHRNLKPSNVLLAEDGPRLIDFGISRAAAEATALTQTGLVIGSPGFMSPEQAMGHVVGPPSDVFNLGAVLAFAATGKGPFGTGTTAAPLYRVAHGTPNVDRVPPAVRPLIGHCLAKDPGQRPTAVGLLAEVGALQPGGDWLPDSFTRTFVPATPSGSGLAPSGPAPAWGGSRARRAWRGARLRPGHTDHGGRFRRAGDPGQSALERRR